MATLTWEITTTAGTVSESGPDISDANMDRFFEWLTAEAYVQTDENGDPLPVDNAVRAAAFREWAQGQWEGVKAQVLRYEQQEAAQQAAGAVTDIEA